MTDRKFGIIAGDMDELIVFMNGHDGPYLRELVSYFSLDSRYCHPRELKLFWESLTESEKNYYRDAVFYRSRVWLEL